MPLDRHKLRWNGWGWRDYPDSLATREDVWRWLAAELRMPALLFTPALPLEDAILPPSRLSEQDNRVLARIAEQAFPPTNTYERAFHARGRSYNDLLRLRAGDLSSAPDGVVYPASAEQVLMLLAYAAERGISVIPYGGGTGMTCGATPISAGPHIALTVDLSQMEGVEQVDAQSLTAHAQAGIYGPALEKTLAEHRLTLGNFPQAFEFSTLGGWIAHRSAGPRVNGSCWRPHWLVTAEVATPRGMMREIPDALTDLIAGSAGMFGIVTAATVRVRPAAEAAAARAWLCRDFDSGVSAIREAVQNGVPAAMLRLSDAEATRFRQTFTRLDQTPSLADRAANLFLNRRAYANGCTLIALFEGTEHRVRYAKDALGRIARRHGALPLGEAPARQWRNGRFHGPYLRDTMLDRGVGVDTIQTAASWSNLLQLYRGTRLALETVIGQTVPRAGARGIILCHLDEAQPAGANLGFTFIFPRSLDDEIGQWRAIRDAVSKAIAANGGAASGPGSGEFPPSSGAQEMGGLASDVLAAIKRTLDPKGILKPEKLVP